MSARRSMNRRARRASPLAGLLALAVLTAPAAAAEQPKKLLIETIRVDGITRASAALIINESLIVEGRSYSERELREAAYRIKRLPFVIDVDLSLEKGSRRDHYLLVLDVEETERVFFSLGLTRNSYDREVFHDQDDYDHTFVQAGARAFIGRHGVTHVSVGTSLVNGFGDELVAEVGHTQYNLFGRGSFVSLTAGRGDDFTNSSLSLRIGIPIQGNHALQLSASQTEREDQVPSWWWDGDDPRSRDEMTHRSAAIGWFFDSRDDPLFPSRGLRLDSRLEWQDRTTLLGERNWWVPGSPAELRTEAERLAITFEGIRYLPMSDRSSLSFALAAAAATTDVTDVRLVDYVTGEYRLVPTEENALAVYARAGYLKTVWRPRESRWLNDMRWESTVQLEKRWTDGDVFHYYSDDDIGWVLKTSLIWRNRWGLLRLDLRYAERTGDLLTRLR